MSVIPFPQPARGEAARLGELLAGAREELATRMPPPWIEAQLRAELARRPSGLRHLRPVAAADLAVAGSAGAPVAWRAGPDGLAWLVALAVLFGLLIALGGRGAATQAPATIGFFEGAGFQSVVAPQRWSQWGGAQGSERAWLIEAELPAQQLASLGLPFDPARAAEPVRAELLLHASGEILAVRLPR